VIQFPRYRVKMNGMAKSEDTVKLIIGKELKIRFKSLCVQTETDMSAVVKDLIAVWCLEQEKKLATERKKG
jgi:ParG